MFAQIFTRQELSWIRTSNSWGLVGLYLFAFGAYVSPPLSAFGLGLMFIALILCLPKMPPIWRDPLFIVSVAFTIFLICRTVVAIGELPATRTNQIDKALDLIRLGYFCTIVLAFWLARNPQKIYSVLLLSLTGLLIRIIINIKTDNLYKFLAHRPGFDMPVNAFGLYAAVVVLGLLILAPQCWGSLQTKRLFFLRAMFWGVVLLVFMEGLITSQSRSAYLACLVVFPPLLSIRLFSLIKSDSKFSQKHITIFVVIFLFLITTLFVLQKNMIARRVISKWKSIELLIEGQVAKMPRGGIKARCELLRLGAERWLQRPFWGWGPGSSIYLLKQSKIKRFRRVHSKILKDFHNSYIEILVQIGLLGALFFAASLWLAIKSLWDAYSADWIRLEMFLFTLGALTLFLIATNFNLRTGDLLGRHHLILFGGIAYAYRYHQMMFRIKTSDQPVKQS